MTEQQLHATSWDEVLVDLPAPVPPTELRAVVADLRTGIERLLHDHAHGSRIKVDRYKLPRALTCPASAADGEFVTTAVTTSRALGLRAIDPAAEGTALLDRIRWAVEYSIDTNQWMSDFLVGQDNGARATTLAHALNWASRTLTEVPRHLIENAQFVHKPIWHSPVRDAPVALVGRPDAVIRPPNGVATDRVLLSLGWPEVRVAALDALVVALDAGTAPRRYLAAYAPSGTVYQADVTPNFLRDGVTWVLEAIGALAPAAVGEPLHAEPSHACWHCDHRANCEPGQRWTDAQPNRRGGLLIS